MCCRWPSGAAVHVIHVWQAVGEDLVRSWSGAVDPDMAAAAYISDVQAGHREALDALVAEAEAETGMTFSAHLRRGEAREAIPEAVAAFGADLLVMGTIARTGVPGFIIGNTAEDVLNSVECAVLTVKPPGYESPVRPRN